MGVLRGAIKYGNPLSACRFKRTQEYPVAEHFNSKGHTLVDMTIVVINQLYSHDSCLCKIWESRWIRTLGTSHPFGTLGTSHPFGTLGTSYPFGMNLRVKFLWNLLNDHLLTPWNFTSPTDTKATGYPKKYVVNMYKHWVLLALIDLFVIAR